MPTGEVAALAAEENIRGNVLEISCAKCRRFLGEVSVESKAVARIKCKCGGDTFLVVGKDRLTVVQREGQTVPAGK